MQTKIFQILQSSMHNSTWEQEKWSVAHSNDFNFDQTMVHITDREIRSSLVSFFRWWHKTKKKKNREMNLNDKIWITILGCEENRLCDNKVYSKV